MQFISFSQFMIDEGFLLPDRPPRKGMLKLNVLPMTDARRMNLYPKVVKKSAHHSFPAINKSPAASLASLNLSHQPPQSP